ncbi:MAG TPA: CDP-glucose 4,6-dehydratase [Methylophilaceae bacterium]|nr:CDP-glucose 4,6-dehydratase [Methylophilaceae bacterium]
MNKDFWQGKRVFLTGHTGFKGGWLALWLHRLGAEVHGYSLTPGTEPNLFTEARVDHSLATQTISDVRDFSALNNAVTQCQPDIVLHLAAQPLVRQSYKAPIETYSTNVMGTVNLLETVRGVHSIRVVVNVTTDKCYENQEWHWPYREEEALGGHDPYSSSKACSEIVTSAYRRSFFSNQDIAIASARAGNVIGGGDWSSDRLIPDAIRAWEKGQILEVRHPQAIRPWQHVLEPLNGYLTLAEKIWHSPDLAGPFNFGPHTHEAASVRDVIELARNAYGQGEVRYSVDSIGPHEANWLALETSKSRNELGVQPKWPLADAVTRTIAWYRAHHGGANARDLCLAEIAAYETHE